MSLSRKGLCVLGSDVQFQGFLLDAVVRGVVLQHVYRPLGLDEGVFAVQGRSRWCVGWGVFVCIFVVLFRRFFRHLRRRARHDVREPVAQAARRSIDRGMRAVDLGEASALDTALPHLGSSCPLRLYPRQPT